MRARNHRLRATNLMDDDLCLCGWESTGHEDEDEAMAALDDHIASAALDEKEGNEDH